MACNPSLYHYNGFCFNRSRIPEGMIAIREAECDALEREERREEEQPISMIID